MKERHSYIGKTKDGINGIWTDVHPEDAVIEQEMVFYAPDEGKVFEKDGNLFSCVIIKDGVKIEDFVEIDTPIEEEPETEGGEDGEEAE